MLRADEVNVRIDSAGGHYIAFARNNFGARPNFNGDAGLDIRIARLAYGADASVFNGDVGFDYAPVIENQCIGDDGIGRIGAAGLALAHTIADHLTAAKFYFFTVNRVVLLDLNPKLGIRQAHPVAYCGAEHIGVGAFAHGLGGCFFSCHLL